jgi:hypothetical protein
VTQLRRGASGQAECASPEPGRPGKQATAFRRARRQYHRLHQLPHHPEGHTGLKYPPARLQHPDATICRLLVPGLDQRRLPDPGGSPDGSYRART